MISFFGNAESLSLTEYKNIDAIYFIAENGRKIMLMKGILDLLIVFAFIPLVYRQKLNIFVPAIFFGIIKTVSYIWISQNKN